jgi:type I restriction enzyme, S subunit
MNWQEVRLGDICEFKYGKALPSTDRKIGRFSVYGSNGVVGQHDEAITDGPAIIIGRKGSIGEVHIGDAPCWPIDTTYFVDRTCTKTDLKWLSYQLGFLGLRLMNKAAAIPGLNRSDAYEKRVLLPPLDEQRRIAAILDAAGALRQKRRQALRLLDQLSQSIFIEMFGDPAPNDTSGSLGDQLTFVTSGGRGWAQYYAPSGVRFIRSFDVQMNEIGAEDVVFVAAPDNAEARRTRTQSGDVLLTITGSRIGRVAPVLARDAGAHISQHVAILRPVPNLIDPVFLSYFLSLPNGGQRQIAKSQYGQTKPGLNFEQIRNFKVPHARLNQQAEFCERVGNVCALSARLTTASTHLDALFTSLQHRAFRGEL